MNQDAEATADKPRVEIGWLVFGAIEAEQVEAVRRAAETARARLSEALPGFDWRIPVVRREDRPEDQTAYPVRLLDIAESERDSRNWDFVLVITGREMVTYTQPFALAALSRLLSAAILSTAHLFPDGGTGDGTDANETYGSDRLAALALHVFGRLNGLDPDVDKGGCMRAFSSAETLNPDGGFEGEDVARLRRRLSDVADLRVEEETGNERINAVSFYLRSLRENRQVLPQAIRRMRPWAFPARLTRLTTAAGSAVLVLLVTAEVWEMAAHLPAGNLILMSVIALIATSAYLLRVQRLLAGPHGSALREQRAVRNAGTVLAVGAGMAVTYAAAFVFVLLVSELMLSDGLLADWVGPATTDATGDARVKTAGFVATLALVIGALGASFEPYSYFRHVTYVDEEI